MKTIKGICLITKDVPRLRDFYQDVLGSKAEGDDAFATFTAAGAQLSICAERIMEEMAPGSLAGAGLGHFTIEVEVGDVDREYQHLTDIHAPIVKPPTTQSWGIRSVWFRDPDGNMVNFFAHVGDGKS
jgi:catechol 2,3-dioxygenase-like lactoylglutathione lyase family enzyme